MTLTIEERPAGSGAICHGILSTIGDWFGIPASNAEYEQRAETGPAIVALLDREPAGLMLLKDHFGETLEIYFIGVRADLHRRGVGRALMERAEAIARESGARFVSLKTLGPSQACEPYERTRAFYRALGYAALEEFTEIWGPENPSLLMAKAI